MKKALLSSIVLASLLLVGCGGDDDPKKDGNTTTEQPDNNGTENNESNNTTINPNNVVLNNLEWTPLKENDDNNDSNSGKVSLATAKDRCVAAGMHLPTLAELNATLSDNNGTMVSSLKSEPKFNFDNAVESNGGSALFIWFSESNETKKGFALYKDNSSDDGIISYELNNIDPDSNGNVDKGFYTCVKPVE